MDEYITRNNAISAVCLGCNQQFSDEPCEPSDCTIRRSIMALPAADVAPRAEVAKLHEVIFKKEDLMQKIAEERNKYADELETAKDTNEHLAVMLEEAKMTIGVNAQKALEVTLEEIENAKREVAREIFEEIEKTADACIESELLRGSWFNMSKFKESLAELKNKYAEGRNER